MLGRAWMAVVLGTIVACGTEQSSTPFTRAAEEAAAEAITAERIRSVVAELADDSYAGRGPGSEGDAMARRYLAEQLEAIGFAPGAPGGSWEQPFELIGVTATQPATWSFSKDGEMLELAQGEEFIVSSGVQRERAEVRDAEVVFVGYGIQAPEYAWDDFKDADLSGKVLLMLNNDPDWDPDLFAGETRLYYGRWTYKYESAARQGAAGAIIIHTPASAGYPWQVVQTSWTGEQFELPAGDEPRIEVAGWISEGAANELVALAGRDLVGLVEAAKRQDFQPVSLGVTTSISLRNQLSRKRTANVLGLLRGSDANLAEEVVIYSAHHDHLGVGMPNPDGDPADRIYNGARDNASGVAMVLAIAQAFAALPQPPRRSILVAFVGAEEQGLLGSEYFATHPTVPPGRIAANVNFDAANIWGRTRDITFIGYGRSTLDDVARQVADRLDRVVRPDAFPDRGFYYRSDQFSFAKIGVPAFYFSSGTDFLGHPAGWGTQQINAYTELHYHQPSDELTEDWVFDGMVEDARFGFWAGLIVANADDMPRWNPGDEFEAAREAAVSALP